MDNSALLIREGSPMRPTVHIETSAVSHPIDPVISEGKAVRDAHAARLDYNVAAIFRDIQAMQEKSDQYSVRLPGRPVVASSPANDLSDDELDAPVTNSDL